MTKEIYNWILDPAGRCVSLLSDAIMLNSLLTRSVIAANAQRGLLTIARDVALRRNERAKIASYGRLIEAQGLIEEKARELIAANFHVLNVQGIISLWVAIEVAVEDTVIAILMNDEPSARQIVEGFTKGKPQIPPGPLNADSANLVFKRMEKAARDQATVMDAYCWLLARVNVQLELLDEESKVLTELYCVRNCVMHRGGIVDSEIAAKAPELGVVVGDHICIDKDCYLRYIEAGNAFAVKLLGAVLVSPYIQKRSE
jgi:hypothetical protein